MTKATPAGARPNGSAAEPSFVRHVLPDYYKAFAVIAHPVAIRCENCS